VGRGGERRRLDVKLHPPRRLDLGVAAEDHHPGGLGRVSGLDPKLDRAPEISAQFGLLGGVRRSSFAEQSIEDAHLDL
jgi:hypothetical protein